MKFCKDCKHFYDSSVMYYCTNPNLGIDPVLGEVNSQFASVARSNGIGNSVSCGPRGSWFELKGVPPIEVKKRRSLLEWFKGIGNGQ